MRRHGSERDGMAVAATSHRFLARHLPGGAVATETEPTPVTITPSAADT